LIILLQWTSHPCLDLPVYSEQPEIASHI